MEKSFFPQSRNRIILYLGLIVILVAGIIASIIFINNSAPYETKVTDWISDKSHLACRDEMCRLVVGEGTNECSLDADCHTATHFVCTAMHQCTEVAGVGDDECGKDADCIPPGGETFTPTSNLTITPSVVQLHDLLTIESSGFNFTETNTVWIENNPFDFAAKIEGIEVNNQGIITVDIPDFVRHKCYYDTDPETSCHDDNAGYPFSTPLSPLTWGTKIYMVNDLGEESDHLPISLIGGCYH